MLDDDCIFCKIIKGDISSSKILETDHILSFMDVSPLSPGHCLFIPKSHHQRAHEVSDEVLAEILVAIKKVARALQIEDYNILQNNGAIAHQAVKHVHFHLIPKPDNDQGLKIGWNPPSNIDQDQMAEIIRKNL
ncbi:MAG: HIT domain-containing protein [Candidatus Kariarchaeaceae archaeon]